MRLEIEQTLKNLEEQVTDEVEVDPKWHKNFVAKRAKLIQKISEDNCNVKISFPKTNSSAVVLKGPRDAIDSAKKQILDVVYELENHVRIEVSIPQRYHISLIGKKGINSLQISEEFKVEIQFPAKLAAAATEPNGSAEAVNNANSNESEEYSNPSSPAHGPNKADIIYVSGSKENCEKAKQALLALVPINENCDFPQKFHKNLLENKAEILKELSNQFNVQVNVPKKTNETADYLTIVGIKENIDAAKLALADKLNEFELNNFSVEIVDIKPELIPQLRGRNGTEANRMEAKFQVRIDFSRKGEPDKIVIKGLKEKVLECESFIRKKIQDDSAKTSQEIEIDHRVHSRIIGQKGKTIAKFMEKYKVDVKFTGRNSNVVTVKGPSQEAVDDACDQLKNLEEEYLQDVIDKEAYTHPSSKSDEHDHKLNGQSNGFVVSGAPWEQTNNKASSKQAQANNARNLNEPAPDTANMDLFPTIITAAVNGEKGSSQKSSWGPSRK